MGNVMKKIIRLIPILLAIAIAATMTFAGVIPASAQPSEVWVDDDYCDGCLNDGHTWEYDAFAKIQDGIDVVASPGTVHVAAGTYSEQVMISSKNEVTILGEDKQTTIVDGTGITWVANGLFNLDYLTNKITISGFTVRNGVYGIRADSSGDHTFKYNIITSNDTGGIQLFSSNNNTIAHNEISSNLSQDGIGVSGGSGNVIIANHIITNERCGILLYGAIDHVVTNNVIVNNGRDGIYCYNGSSANTSNNTVVGHGGYGIFTDDSSLIVINNSIIWRNGDDLDGCTATYSDIQDVDAGEGNISTYPAFVDPENGDYHLKDYSLCIGAGTPVGAPDTDIEGNPRPNPPGSNPDIGAYENSLGVPNTPPDSATIRVPADYPTIQAAIDTTSHGDTVLVADGTYTGAGNKNLDFKGKAITLRSDNGPENCIIDSEGDGRGFYFHSVEGEDSVVSGFTITNGRADRGGGMYCKDSSSPTIKNCIISENSSIGIEEDGYFGDGAGILCESSSPSFVDCTLSRNSASYRGSGIYCNDSSPTITNCVISANSAKESGGGIMCVRSSCPTITNCTISENSAKFSNGGGIFCGDSSPTITNCTITANSGTHGGGIYCNSSSPTITNCTISANTATTFDGGGVACVQRSSPTVTNCNISNNSADYGGGIHCGYLCSPIITNCTITGNRAKFRYGGGIVLYGFLGYDPSSPRIINCTISANSASTEGGAIYCDSSFPTITNCIFWANSPDELYIGSGDPTVTYSTIEGSWEGKGNIDLNPVFVDPENDDYHIKNYSPCIGSGTFTGAPDNDIEGNPRPNPPCSNPDMGAYENSRAMPDVPPLGVFGIELGNSWKYEGTYQGNSYTAEEKVVSLDTTTFSTTTTYILKTTENGILEGKEWYEKTPRELKLWGVEEKDDEGVFYKFKFSAGLVAAWYPMEVNDHKYSSASMEVVGYPGVVFDVSLTVDVLGKESVALSLGTLEGYKLRYQLRIWGHGEDETDTFYQLVVPYVGVVKYEDDESQEVLTSFAIGGGTINEETDSDGDGLKDYQEFIVYDTNWQDIDTDHDGLSDGEEVDKGTDPIGNDTDGDGLKDGWEVTYNFDPITTNNALQDPDSDELNNLAEQNHGTNPLLADTDGDGCKDGVEVLGDRNPNLPDPQGDLNVDCALDLKDAIIGVQVMARIELLSTVDKEADVNGDGKVGLEEVIYVLQRVSGLRE